MFVFIKVRCQPFVIHGDSVRQRLSFEARQSAIEYNLVALLRARAEATRILLLKQLEPDRIARVDRSAESHEDLRQASWITCAQMLDQTEAGDSERAQAVQNRLCKARLGGHFGVDVDRVVVAVQAIDERLARQGGQVDDPVGCAIRQFRRHGRGLLPASAPTITAEKIGRAHSTDDRAVLRIDNSLLERDDGTLAESLVINAQNLILPAHGRRWLQRAFENDALLAMQD